MKYSGIFLPLLALPALAEPPTITLPLPQGQSMEFSLVPVTSSAAQGGKESLFASYSFELGNPHGGYQQHPTWVTVSGTIFHKGKWVIPVARTEVTRAQYASLVTPKAMPRGNDGAYPKTNVTAHEVQAFMDALNKWLRTNPAAQKACAPLCGELHGRPYARLPLLAEWEYAARGGQEVDKMRFASGNPYADEGELENAEVLQVAHIARVKSQNVCNPCGLYDMLGNVSEMVQQPFFTEYYFGRSGGLQACGGNHATQVKQGLAFHRHEYDAYAKDGSPWKEKTLGFRPVLGASVYSSKIGTAGLNERWEEYVMSAHSQRLTMRPPDERILEELSDIRKALSSLSREGGKGGQATGDLLTMLESRIRKLQESTSNPLLLTAKSGVLTLTAVTIAASRELPHRQRLERQFENAQKDISGKAMSQAMEDYPRSSEATVFYWNCFRECCRCLAATETKQQDEELEAQEKELMVFASKHLPYFIVSRKHYEKYRATLAPGEVPRRLTEQEVKDWEADILRTYHSTEEN